MSSIKIPNDEIKTLLGAEPLDLPKYSTFFLFDKRFKLIDSGNPTAARRKVYI